MENDYFKQGATKRCVFGTCKSDSHKSSTAFIAFPKPCLGVRRQIDNGDKKHIRHCNLCAKSHLWLSKCRREDFSKLLHVKRWHYICVLHFVNEVGPTTENPFPLSVSEASLRRINQQRRSRRKRSPVEQIVDRNVDVLEELKQCPEVLNSSSALKLFHSIQSYASSQKYNSTQTEDSFKIIFTIEIHENPLHYLPVQGNFNILSINKPRVLNDGDKSGLLPDRLCYLIKLKDVKTEVDDTDRNDASSMQLLENHTCKTNSNDNGSIENVKIKVEDAEENTEISCTVIHYVIPEENLKQSKEESDPMPECSQVI